MDHPDIQVNLPDKDGVTPLFAASALGEDGCVKLLLNHRDIQVNLPDKDGETPLYRACFRGRLESVLQLLKRLDVQVNVPDKDGITPFMSACTNGFNEIAKMLLRHLSTKGYLENLEWISRCKPELLSSPEVVVLNGLVRGEVCCQCHKNMTVKVAARCNVCGESSYYCDIGCRDTHDAIFTHRIHAHEGDVETGSM